ncbi:hypothetical protein SAMN02910339_01640 [Lachnospiraceae bacterium YSD2013]|nr:hypothetical protein SAMN02910339_01640 [Lachnospiraceae bacterium YSD2013]
MKRVIKMAGVVLLTVALLAGCGKSTSELREDLTDSVNQKEEESTTVSDSIELTENVEKPIEKEEEEIFERNESEDDSLTEKQKEFLKSHFEITKEDRMGGFIYICVDGMDIYKYSVEESFFDKSPDYAFELKEDEWGKKTIDVFLDSGENRRYIGGIYRESNYGDTEEPLFFGSGMCNENIELREEIEYDTVLDGYLKDFNFEEGSVKIDYATDIHMSPSGGMSLIGNDGVFEDAVVSPDVRFAFYFGIYNEVTVKGFKDRMNRDTDSSMGYSIYFKNGEVVGIADIPSA